MPLEEFDVKWACLESQELDVFADSMFPMFGLEKTDSVQTQSLFFFPS